MKIGLAGPPEAGKNASGDILAQCFGFYLVSFAEALRQEVDAIVMGRVRMPDDLCGTPELDELRILLSVDLVGVNVWEKPTPPKTRRGLQLYGTEYRRHQDSDYWVKQATPIINSYRCVAGTDTRFKNERTPFDEIWYVYNPIAEEKAKQYRHISEGQIKPNECHVILDNSGTLEDLKRNIFAELS